MRLMWSRSLPRSPVGLSLAREPGTLLVWDVDHTLARHDPQGECQLRQQAPGSLVQATISDDGLKVAAIGRRGQVWLTTQDFVPLWDTSLPHRPVALAVDAFGERLAVADDSGGLHVYDRKGQLLWRATTAKPLVHLAFVPELPILVGAAEYGLVCALDDTGQCLWRQTPFSMVGSLAVSGTGQRVLLACYSEGLLQCTAAQAQTATILHQASGSRLVAMSYAGDVLVTTGLDAVLTQRSAEGQAIGELGLSARPIALAVQALGQIAVAALSSGQLIGVELAGRS